MQALLFDRFEPALDTVRSHTAVVPEVALVLGSGLGTLADEIERPISIPYENLDGMPPARISGHAGNLVLGFLEGRPVAALQGRSHLYEGLRPDEVVFGVRLMGRLGATSLVITNAAGGIDSEFAVGDLMRITDHLNLTGQSCLVGANDDRLGPRFPDMSQAYDPALADVADRCADSLGFALRTGVYAGLLGPAYETPAEIQMLRALGASAVGMSTVLEVIAARHMGLRVLGVSCITNAAAGLGGPLAHADVKEVAARVRPHLAGLVRGVVRSLA